MVQGDLGELHVDGQHELVDLVLIAAEQADSKNFRQHEAGEHRPNRRTPLTMSEIGGASSGLQISIFSSIRALPFDA